MKQRLSLALLAAWPRLAFIAISMLALPFPWERWIAMRDGARHIDFAFHFGNGDMEALRDIALTFPGYPLAILLFGKLLGNGLAGVALNVLGAVITVLLFDAVWNPRGDRRHLSLWLAVFPPAWVLYSSMVMTEGLFLAVTMLGVWLFVRDRPLTSSFVFGAAALVKMQAVFPLAGCLLVLLVRRRYLLAVGAMVVAALLPVAWALWCRYALGDALVNVHHYAEWWGGSVFTWPFGSLVAGTVDTSLPLWKKLYAWAHVALALAACGLLLRRWWRTPRSDDLVLITVWMIGNTACILCLGDVFGFHEFHRFMLPALPPLILALEPVLPRATWTTVLAGAAAVAMSVFALAV